MAQARRLELAEHKAQAVLQGLAHQSVRMGPSPPEVMRELPLGLVVVVAVAVTMVVVAVEVVRRLALALVVALVPVSSRPAVLAMRALLRLLETIQIRTTKLA
ncbi:hypothetical protein D3C72_1295280 [compost metagenome]